MQNIFSKTHFVRETHTQNVIYRQT